MEPLTPEMIMVMVMISIAIVLFIFEWIRVDVVAILMMVTLPLLHLVSPKEAFMGLSSNAVVSIIAVIIIGAGLDKTGLINRLVGPIVRVAGKSQSRVVIAISLTVAVISSFMQNIGAAALFLPAIQRVSKSLKFPISSLLMPIGFSAILGGTVTLVGSSPLILLNDLLEPFSLKPFSLFDVTPIGLALVASGITCFILLGRFILPKGEKGTDDEGIHRAINDKTLFTLNEAYELHTPTDFTHYRDPVTVGDLRRRYLVNVVAITEPQAFKAFSLEHPPQVLKVFSPGQDIQVTSDMDLAVFGPDKNVTRMAEAEGMVLKDTVEVFKDDIEDTSSGIVEAVLAPRSLLSDRTLNQVNLQDRYHVTPIAIYRRGETYLAEIGDMKLELGDTIILYGSWHNLMILHEEKTLLFSTPEDVELLRPEKAFFAGLWLAIALMMIMVFKIQLSVSLMTGALGMIITRVLSIDEAYQSVDWRTIFLLGGLIPLGVATEKTGAAAWIAHTVLHTIGPVSPIVLLTVIGILSTIFTLVISNVGATVLLVPLVVNMAITAQADPRMAALVVGLATSNSFMLPTHQVNALYMGPGRYRSVDFMKAGLVISVVFIIVMITMIYLIHGV
jgi:di/tricarboxylate transporter